MLYCLIISFSLAHSLEKLIALAPRTWYWTLGMWNLGLALFCVYVIRKRKEKDKKRGERGGGKGG